MAPSRLDTAHDGRIQLGARRRGLSRWLGAFVAIVVLAEIAARVVVPAAVPEIRWIDAGAQLRIEAMDADDRRAEVVFAGTSSAGQAFVPSVFERVDDSGRSSFNASLAGAVPTVMGPWLVDEVVPRLDPDLIVWGLSPLDFSTAYGDDQLVAYRSAVETRGGLLAEVDRRVGSVSQLVESRRILRSPTALFGTDADARDRRFDQARATTGPDGERVDFGVDVGAERRAITRTRLDGFGIDDADVDAIATTIETLQASGVEVVLVELPLPNRFRDQLPGGDADANVVSSSIRSLGERLGVDVMLMPRALGDRRFVDFTHVESDAAAVVTEWVARGLAELGDASTGSCSPLGLRDDFGFDVAVDLCRNA